MCGFEILHKLWQAAWSKQRKYLEQWLVFVKPILQFMIVCTETEKVLRFQSSSGVSAGSSSAF